MQFPHRRTRPPASTGEVVVISDGQITVYDSPHDLAADLRKSDPITRAALEAITFREREAAEKLRQALAFERDARQRLARARGESRRIIHQRRALQVLVRQLKLCALAGALLGVAVFVLDTLR